MLRNVLLIWRDARLAAKKHGISTWQIIREQIALRKLRQLQPSEYYIYGLDDPNRSWEEKKAFIGHQWVRKLWFTFTPERYYYLFMNKLIFKHFFAAQGFPVAELYGTYDPQWGQTADGFPLRTADDIAGWMGRSGVQEVVFKPVEGEQGRMVYVMASRKQSAPNVFVSVDGEDYTPQRIANTLTDPRLLTAAYPGGCIRRSFLVERRLCSHPDIVNITESQTLCCLRLVTLLTRRGTVEIIGNYFKIQPRNTAADNFDEGGDTLFASVDQQTGILQKGVFYYRKDRTRHARHPDGGKEFFGRKLPLWDEAVCLAHRAARAFPLARTVGWDIAMTNDGVYLIEGNVRYGMVTLQFVADRGLATPDFLEASKDSTTQIF